VDSQIRKRGRPPKNGVTEPWRFARALKIIYAYDKARVSGLKHTAAIREAVGFVRQLDPEMPVSETEVKRILAELRPSTGSVALLSNYEVLEGEEAARLRSRLAQMFAFAERKDTEPPNQDPSRPLKRFSIGYGKRPNYPRHNAKNPNS